MTHSKPQVIIDLDEYNALKKQIESLTQGTGEEGLTEFEYQDAIGRLLYSALSNPGLYRGINNEVGITLGPYQISWIQQLQPAAQDFAMTLRVKITKKK